MPELLELATKVALRLVIARDAELDDLIRASERDTDCSRRCDAPDTAQSERDSFSSFGVDRYSMIPIRVDDETLGLKGFPDSDRSRPGAVTERGARRVIQAAGVMPVRQRSIQALRRARDEAEQANRTKDEMLASFDHDLQAPNMSSPDTPNCPNWTAVPGATVGVCRRSSLTATFRSPSSMLSSTGRRRRRRSVGRAHRCASWHVHSRRNAARSHLSETDPTTTQILVGFGQDAKP